MHDFLFTAQGVALEEAEKAVVLIHGRGAPPEDILGLADYFDDGKTYFAAPQADHFTWYPNSFLVPRAQNQPWLDSALDNLERLIAILEQKLLSERIFIMGFSQGACLTAEITCRNARRFGGIAVFTGGLIGQSVERRRYKGDFKSTKVYISNGDGDPHIPLERTEETATIMKELGAEVVKEIFPNRPHTINMSEIEKVRSWLLNL